MVHLVDCMLLTTLTFCLPGLRSSTYISTDSTNDYVSSDSNQVGYVSSDSNQVGYVSTDSTQTGNVSADSAKGKCVRPGDQLCFDYVFEILFNGKLCFRIWIFGRTTSMC